MKGIDSDAELQVLFVMVGSDYNCIAQAQLGHFRRTAFLAVAFSTVAVLACVVGLPLAYTYIQRVHSSMMSEMDYCRVNAITTKLREQCTFVVAQS